MGIVEGLASERGFTEFLQAYPKELALSDEDPAAVLDRYFTPDIEYVSDGLPLDRTKLIDHARPARRNVTACTVDVHTVVVGDGVVAAHYTLAASMRKGSVISTDIGMFARLSADGRIHRVRQVTHPTAG